MRRLPLGALLISCALFGGACGGADSDAGSATGAATAEPDVTAAPEEQTARTAAVGLRTIASNLQVPWGIGFLPGGDALVAQRTNARIVRIPEGGGRPRAVLTVPGVATDSGEGGLLGLAVSPTFGRDRLVYVYYSTSSDNRIARFRLGSRRLEPILTGLKVAGIHNGGRIAFGPDGKLYATVGDAGDTGDAQDRESLNGKILRMDPDGSRPADNPGDNLVFSLGHRNPQGIAWDSRGRMYAAEFGQNTFDEINRIQAGRNYGWPTVEGRGDTDGGRFTNPLKTFRTSDASPSGIAIRGGKLYMAALGGNRLYTMPIRANGSLGDVSQRYAGRWGRLRTVVAVRGGRGLWLSTSNRDGRGDPAAQDDRIFRIPG